MSNRQIDEELAHLQRVILRIRSFDVLPAAYWRKRIQTATLAKGLTRSQTQHLHKLQEQLAGLERALEKGDQQA